MDSSSLARRTAARLGLGPLALVLGALGCGSVPDSTSCVFEGSCGVGVIDATPPADDSAAEDTGPGADAACTPGATKREDCNECVCSATAVWTCTTRACVDTAPPPSSACPDVPTPGGACIGHGHCRYTDPCVVGCDCVDDHWVCGSC